MVGSVLSVYPLGPRNAVQSEGRVTASAFDRRRLRRPPLGGCILTLLVICGCGDEQGTGIPANVPLTNAPSSVPSIESDAESPASGATPGQARGDGADATETTAERVDEGLDLVAEEPEASGAEAPEEPGADEPEQSDEEVPPDPARSIPTIGAPGFPGGSGARLVPMEIVGPITGLPVLFNIYLPPGYDSDSAAYPVLYDLHGLADSRDTNPGPVIRSLEAAMRNSVIGPLIVVFPQGYIEAYWADTRDGVRPGETQVIRELLPYVDANFRTLDHRARRGVSGFSMGGFGALAYATKYPDRFSVGISYDGALDTWETLVGRRAYIASAAFGNDEGAFDQISPWANAARNASLIVESTRLRGVPGNQYRAFNQVFRDHMATLAIPYDYVETTCDHNYACLIDSEGAGSWAIIQAEFSKPATESMP